MRCLFLVLGAAFLATAPAVAQPPSALPPEVRAGRSAAPLAIDGALSEEEWSQAGVIAGLTQQEPEPGGANPYRTEVRVLAADATLYIGIRAVDPEPSRIAVHTLQRDADLEGDDSVAIVLDSFGDGRTGYLFRVNAGGARQDGLVAESGDSSFDWDGLWQARTRRTPDGWTAEIAIDVKSLRFKPGLDAWGFNVERYVARDRTTLRWAGATRDARLADLRRAGRLAGCAGLRQGLGLAVSPYLLGRLDDRRETGTHAHGDLGADAAYNVTPGIGAVLTVNTDFAETEVDARQVNLTRFPLFFPEKRPFFLEGSNLFRFGLGLEEDFLPFYSRRIGLLGGRAVPIDAGVKILGRSGRWSLAALDVQAAEAGAGGAANLLAGRTTYDAGAHLRLGAVLTAGDPAGEGSHQLGGFDALWRTSTFRGDKNLAVGGWTARSGGDLGAGSPWGWGVQAEYPNDLWDLSVDVHQFGAALDPSLGFLPRAGIRKEDLGVAYQPRPAAAGRWSWVRQFFFEIFGHRVERLDGGLETWRWFLTPFNVETRTGEHLEANFQPELERLNEPFEIAPGLVIPPGEYRFDRYRIDAQSASSRPWRIGTTFWFGAFYGGDLIQWQSFLSRTIGPGRLRLELDAENDFGHLPQGDFVQRLWQVKSYYAFDPDLVLSVFGQYDSESRDLGFNSRLRWTLRPGRDLFLVWDHNWKRLPGSGLELRREEDQLVFKLRWSRLW
jgi:hypothetical protein